MGNRKQKNAASIKATDGRKHNSRKPSKVKTKEITQRKATMTPAKLNQAKKDQISTYAIKAMKKVFGSEAEAWESLAEQAKDSFAHRNLLWQYAYGKPGEQDKGDGGGSSKAPVINFYASPEQIKEVDNTIDVDAVDVDELNDEE